MTKLGTGIDEAQVDALQVLPGRMLHQSLTKDQRTLLHSNHSTLDHDPILTDHTIMDESTHGGDTLLGQISISLTTSIVTLLTNTVNLLVHLSTMEVTVLTSTRHRIRNTGRMPRSNTGNLTQTTMGLTGKTSDTPTGGDSLITMTLGDTKNINELILGEDGVNSDLLLEKTLGEVNLGTGISTSIDLDLHDVRLLDTQMKLLHLGVGDDTNSLAELADALELGLNILSVVFGVLLGVLGVSLSLGLVPVLVRTTLELFTQMLRENGGQGTKTTGGFKVSNNTNDNHGWGLEDGNSIDNLTLVHDGTGAVDTTDDVGHTGLVRAEGSEMGRSRGIIVLGEGSDASGVVLGAFLGEVSQVTTTGGFEFTVGHF
mmetsp:Transcript_16940/g.30735  ORF Transcript_16940/g.30735 Transcript_16940/m.30735 type:complete len:372 (+) Transcript_16940:253-1368(+)